MIYAKTNLIKLMVTTLVFPFTILFSLGLIWLWLPPLEYAAQPNSDTISPFFERINHLLRAMTQPVTPTIVFMTEGFEDAWPPASGVWELKGDPTWGQTTYNVYSGTGSLWNAQGGEFALDPATANYSPTMTAWAVYGPLDLADVESAMLTFDYWNQTEIIDDKFHWLASTDTLRFAGFYTSGDSHGWQTRRFDLADPAHGKQFSGYPQIWVAFLFTSDPDNLTRKGTFVDNVILARSRWGMVYQPNPVATSHDLSLVDNLDADDPRLTAQR